MPNAGTVNPSGLVGGAANASDNFNADMHVDLELDNIFINHDVSPSRGI